MLLDPNLNTSRNIVTILRKYFKKEIMIKFTAVKAVPNKKIFSKTSFYKNLFGKIIYVIFNIHIVYTHNLIHTHARVYMYVRMCIHICMYIYKYI